MGTSYKQARWVEQVVFKPLSVSKKTKGKFQGFRLFLTYNIAIGDGQVACRWGKALTCRIRSANTQQRHGYPFVNCLLCGSDHVTDIDSSLNKPVSSFSRQIPCKRVSVRPAQFSSH